MPPINEDKRFYLIGVMNEFPQSSNRQLARIAYQRNPAWFTDVEQVRGLIRWARGAQGPRSRRTVSKAVPPYQFKFPTSFAKEWTKVQVESEHILVLPDIHIPFHDRKAVEAAVKEGKRRAVDCVILSGDQYDFFSVSRFDRNPSTTKLVAEIWYVREFMGWLRDQFPHSRIIFKLGNHDERLEHYLWRKAPELLGINSLTLQQITCDANVIDPSKMDRDKPQGAIRGIEWVDDQACIQIGALDLMHGHELGKGSIAPPVNPARGAFLRAIANTMVGHHHKQSEHAERSSRGQMIVCWSMGCLCGLWPDYAKVNKWGHGCGFIHHVSGKPDFEVELKRIIDGVMY